MRKLNILNLATTDQGGAGAASLYFNELFNRVGHHSKLLVKQSKLKNKDVIVLKNNTLFSPNRILSRLEYEWKNLKNKRYKDGPFDSKYFFFNEDESKQHISAKKILDNISFKPDVIVLHWISNFVNSKTINELAKATNAKIVWLLMDNAPLTGGCHYPWDCIGFHSDCSNCPAILTNSKKNIALKNLALKIEFQPNDLEVITCSDWDLGLAKVANIFKNRAIHKILFPVDENIFKPADKLIAKQYFNIDSSKKVIFYGTPQLDNIRKGSRYFLDAIPILQEELNKEDRPLDDWVILVAGTGLKDSGIQLEIPLIEVGFLEMNNLIKAFQAADIFVSTSLQDSGPFMINQSIMCATPVVSFAMGVSLDLVINGETGYKAKLKDSIDLAYGIKYILDLNDREYKKMSENCREIGLKLCHPQKQAAKLIEIFQTNNKKHNENNNIN